MMNNDLSGVLKEADPNEVIEQLKVALKEKSAVIDDLKAERDAYRNALEEIYSKGMFGYINGDAAGTLAIMAKEVLDQYPSPSLKENYIDNG